MCRARPAKLFCGKSTFQHLAEQGARSQGRGVSHRRSPGSSLLAPSHAGVEVSSKRAGFLLVEATLTAVVIGVGLVFISRGLAGNVKQLSTIQQYDHVLQLAESTLAELAARAQQQPPLPMRTDRYAPPDQAYEWTLEVEPMAVEGLQPEAMSQVSLIVGRHDGRPPVVRLRTVWSSAWLTGE